MTTDLDHLSELLAKATPGPWNEQGPLEGLVVDCDLSNALRNAAPAMLAELRALREYYRLTNLATTGQWEDVDQLVKELSKARAKVEALKEGK